MTEAIVVGGGHNGLTCAAYLARAGIEVVVLEARDEVGGCASTVAALDGARVNVCNCDHTLVRASGIVEELDLAAHGLRYLDLDPAQLALPWGGEAPWLSFHDAERTLESLALTHPDQVAGYRRYLADMTPIARLVGEMTRTMPTPLAAAREVARQRGRGMTGVLKLSRRTIADVLRDYFTSEALLGPVATTGPAVWGLPPDAPGSGLGALGYAFRHLGTSGRPVGGSGALTDALAAAVTTAGGEIRTGTRVARILCAGEAVAGVELTDGERIDAPIVIAATDPRLALVDWLTDPPAAARKLVERWRRRPRGQGYESKLDAVISTPPTAKGLSPEYLAALGVTGPLGCTHVAAPSLHAISEAHRLAGRGEIAAQPLILSNTPSAIDPAMVPAGGGHVFSLEVMFTPYGLNGGWADTREPERWLEAYATLLEPGFLDSIQRWRLVGPEDYERDFSMPAGFAPSFSGGPLAALLGRDRELTRYTTPVDGLYLTGAGTFPGAGVAGSSGRNAAHVVLDGRPIRSARAA
jgi:phytoene dehydrogenase-like protein